MPESPCPECAELRAEIERLADYDALVSLVERFRQWDDLPGRGDGPFWMREADAVLGRLNRA